MFEEGKYYPGVVTGGGLTPTSKDGHPLLWARIKTAEGTITWEQLITDRTVLFFPKTLNECFGITEAQLAVEGFYVNEMPGIITGEEVIVVASSKPSWRDGDPPIWFAKWLNPCGFRHKPATQEVAAKAASFFKKFTQPTTSTAPKSYGLDDSNVPF